MTEAADYRQFYGKLGERYDQMTAEELRWQDAAEGYREFFRQFKPSLVLDAGCGTGGEAVAIAQAGFQVLGVDGSPEFIDIAAAKAASLGVRASFRVDDLRTLRTVEDASVDALVCRGNTLPHLLTTSELSAALEAFKRALKPGGLLALGWLNYAPVLKSKQRLIGVRGDRQQLFTRFYDFGEGQSLTFNILATNYQDGWRTEWLQTQLTAWSADDVGMLMAGRGWRSLELVSDLKRSDFDPESSKDVVLLAVKA